MIVLEPRPAPSRLFALASPLIAIALTLMASAALMAAMGRDPLAALSVYFVSPFQDAYSRAELVVKAIPLALIGAGLSVCFRANVWNIGAAGQFTLGALAAGGLALALPDATGPLWLIPYLLAGCLGGMVWAAIPALLRTRFNANEILVSLMLTYVAALLLDLLVRGPWRSPLSFGFPQSRDFADAFALPVLVISQDLDEIFEIADRIAVLRHGRPSQAADASAMTPERVGLLMGGAHPEAA